MERHWICYVKGTGGGISCPHNLEISAVEEAERLARKTGKRVHLYEWKGVCRVTAPPEPPIAWEVAQEA